MNTAKQRNISGLKPFKKGQSGNPNGRPRKEACITTVLQSRMGVVPQIDIGGKVNTKTWAELIADSLLVNAYKGNAAAMHELMDRIEGKVAQPISGDIGIHRDAKDYTDAELISIIEGRRSGRDAKAEQGSTEST